MKNVLRVMIASAFAALVFVGLAQRLFPGNLVWTTVSGVIGAVVGFILVSPKEFLEKLSKHHRELTEEEQPPQEEADLQCKRLFHLAQTAVTYQTVLWLLRLTWVFAIVLSVIHISLKDDFSPYHFWSLVCLYFVIVFLIEKMHKHECAKHKKIIRDGIRGTIYEEDEKCTPYIRYSHISECFLEEWVSDTRSNALQGLIGPIFWALEIVRIIMISVGLMICGFLDALWFCFRVTALTCRAVASTGRWSAAIGGVLGGLISLINQQELLLATGNGALVGGGIFLITKVVTVLLPSSVYMGRKRLIWSIFLNDNSFFNEGWG
jgi:hypothetical protein